MTSRFDAITLEVLWTRLISVVDEAAKAIVRTSFSTLSNEANDFACVLTENSGRQSSLRERTRISFLIGLNAPKCHDLVSLAPQPSMPHFHPLPCPPRTSRFLTRKTGVN